MSVTFHNQGVGGGGEEVPSPGRPIACHAAHRQHGATWLWLDQALKNPPGGWANRKEKTKMYTLIEKKKVRIDNPCLGKGKAR